MDTVADTTIAIFGAGGNMGGRITNALKDDTTYRMLYVEPSPAGQAKLAEQQLSATDPARACQEADVVVLAVPDNVIGKAAEKIVPSLKSGTLVIMLDPAAPYAGKLPDRQDVAYFVTHPAHTSLFNDEKTQEARKDYFGSGIAKQAIVNALIQGPEEDYARGEKIACKIWGPILRSHRVTLHQMAILEPVLSETVLATCLTVVREAMDEAIRLGVPPAAAKDFLLGHMFVETAILFDEIDWDFSAGCKQAIANARSKIFKDDWKQVFEPANLMASVNSITAE